MHRVKAIISGVIQGVRKKEDIHAFIKAIARNSPPLALISSIKTYPLTPQVPCNDGGISLGQAMKVASLSRKN